ASASGKTNSLAYRKYQLLQLGHLLKENRSRFVEAIQQDMGRPAFESEFYEIFGALSDIGAAVRNLDTWAAPVKPPVDFRWSGLNPLNWLAAGAPPKGAVLVITPFNYPVWLVVEPLVS
ncbi:Aldehyde/histidinol dehydrogenase, partial [Schizophyllum fasciatum]